MDNVGPNWIRFAHLPQKRFLGKLPVIIAYQLYSFMLQYFKKSSKSKSWGKRLHNFGPNWVWDTSLKRIILELLYTIMLCYFKKIGYWISICLSLLCVIMPEKFKHMLIGRIITDKVAWIWPKLGPNCPCPE